MKKPQPPTAHPQPISRRRFLAGVAGGSALLAAGRPPAPAVAQTVARAVTDPGGAAPTGRGRVATVRSPHWIEFGGVHEQVLLDMVQEVVMNHTSVRDPAAAWCAILQPTDRIALKFNRKGAGPLGTGDPMARTLVTSLMQAGFDPEQMTLIEVSPSVYTETGAHLPTREWSSTVYDFGSGQDHLAGWVEQSDAIINVSFLKDHNIAGLTGALKNLSHAVVKHPARYHANGCSPYIADIVALPAIRERVRLHLSNALRVVFNGGPDAPTGGIHDVGLLMAGTDPVAIDMVGLLELNTLREARGLAPIAPLDTPPAYLGVADACGLGASRLFELTVNETKF